MNARQAKKTRRYMRELAKSHSLDLMREPIYKSQRMKGRREGVLIATGFYAILAALIALLKGML